MNAAALVMLPPAAVTTTSRAPAVPGGVVRVTLVALTAVTVALAPPTFTDAPSRLVPTIVITVPPPVGPVMGVTEVMVGVPT